MARWTSKQTVVTVKDGGALSMTVGPGEGNLTIDNLQEDNSEAIAKYDRGTFDGFVEGSDVEQSISISIELEAETLTEAAQNRIADAFLKTGNWSSGTTKDPAGTKWAVQLEVQMTKGATTTKWVIPCVRPVLNFSEGAEGHTMTISGTNYQAITRSNS